MRHRGVRPLDIGVAGMVLLVVCIVQGWRVVGIMAGAVMVGAAVSAVQERRARPRRRQDP